MSLASEKTSMLKVSLDCAPGQSVTSNAVEVGMPVKFRKDISLLITELEMANSMRLRALWLEHIGTTASLRLRPSMMRPVLAYKIQEHAYGGLRTQTDRQIQTVLKSLKPGSRDAGEASSRFKVGTRIVREWKGKTYEVIIVPDGYQYEGEIFKSLSPIANLITGTRWSGPAFFKTKLRD
jgi:hypothetical protein